MLLSSELFVLVIFIIGIPLVIVTLRDSHLPESRLFITAFIVLVFSNIFTVVEGFYFENLFNLLEHSFITIASIIIMIAVVRLISLKKSISITQTDSNSRKENQ